MTNKLARLLLPGVAISALVIGSLPSVPQISFAGKAFAQSHSGGGGSGRGGSQRGGHESGGESGHSGGAMTGGDSGAGTHGSGRGQRGPSADSDGRGSSQNRPAGTRGTKPVWAQEGIPEVELGRLNVVRSPASVLNRQLTEVLSTWNPALAEPTGITIAQLYSMSATQFATWIRTNFSSATIIDSPLANLALLKHLVSDGQTQLTGVTPYSTNDLAAIFIGAASDKSLPISTNTVIAITTILGITVSDPAAVAAQAEIVRQAISAAHG